MKTVILSDETVRNLLEAHASMAAWYYQMAAALRDAKVAVSAPTEQQRSAYIAQLAQHYPEVAAVAASVTAPRAYVPPPAIAAPAQVTENEGVSTPPPPAHLISTPDRVRPETPEPQAAAAAPAPPAEPQADAAESTPPAVPPPPAMVDPSKVNYEDG